MKPFIVFVCVSALCKRFYTKIYIQYNTSSTLYTDFIKFSVNTYCCWWCGDCCTRERKRAREYYKTVRFFCVRCVSVLCANETANDKCK